MITSTIAVALLFGFDWFRELKVSHLSCFLQTHTIAWTIGVCN